jgi:hypothetical protein
MKSVALWRTVSALQQWEYLDAQRQREQRNIKQ